MSHPTYRLDDLLRCWLALQGQLPSKLLLESRRPTRQPRGPLDLPGVLLHSGRSRGYRHYSTPAVHDLCGMAAGKPVYMGHGPEGRAFDPRDQADLVGSVLCSWIDDGDLRGDVRLSPGRRAQTLLRLWRSGHPPLGVSAVCRGSVEWIPEGAPARGQQLVGRVHDVVSFDLTPFPSSQRDLLGFPLPTRLQEQRFPHLRE